MALATACLGHDDEHAASLFAKLGAESDVREAWLGLATARQRLGDPAGAAQALTAALRRHVPAADFAVFADNIVRETGAPGWCGLSVNGELIVRPVAARRWHAQPARWAAGRGKAAVQFRGFISITGADGKHFLGSPVDAAAITATIGCVSSNERGLTGWAWHPADPAIDPVLTIRPVRGRGVITFVASDMEVRIGSTGLLGRPRGFTIPANALAHFDGPLHVLGHNGKDLLGSPLDPRAAFPTAAPVGPVAASARSVSRRRPAVDVVVPVHDGGDVTLACLDSALTGLPRSSKLIVVDDASQDRELIASLDALARRGRITLVRHRRNRGFAASANTGLRSTFDHDVVLLNSDTLVAPGWLQELRGVAYSAHDIGTVTPFSNDATLLSYPDPYGDNKLPDPAATAHMDMLARRANGGEAVEIPVAVGFCMYIRRACVAAVGMFRAGLFAQGYGEENDFCLRARQRGWRHVAAPGAFVAHVGGHSFGAAAQHLKARNTALLERLHPGYTGLIEAYVNDDPLAEARQRLDVARWRASRRRGSRSVILITHAAGGGVERHIAESVERHRANGSRAIVLRPARAFGSTRCVLVSDGTTCSFPNLRYTMPGQLSNLARLLRPEHLDAIEVHHLVGHHPAILDLIGRFGLPYDVHVHDYSWLCGRVALVGPSRRYCGEPDVARCELCVAEAGNLIEEDISVAALRKRSAKLLTGARRVIVPSEDTADRIRRHFPVMRPVVQPHEDDQALSDPSPPGTATTCRVCVVGAIGIHKGFEVLLDCARDAAERRLPLEFVVVGHTIDDRTLLATGRVFITGGYAADEAVTLIKAQNATLALLPSVWPETWCFTLTEAWRAGLRVVAFDIGAQAERIRHTGRGLLLPLGLPPNAVNNALIAAAGLSPTR